jgi:hypothetical protein
MWHECTRFHNLQPGYLLQILQPNRQRNIKTKQSRGNPMITLNQQTENQLQKIASQTSQTVQQCVSRLFLIIRTSKIASNVPINLMPNILTAV